MSRRDEIEALITTHQRRLQKLNEQLAYEGKSADPKVSMEIEDIETKITELQLELPARLFICYKRHATP
jgi:predicted  nucleic acid-binding Zn-ribbon protein